MEESRLDAMMESDRVKELQKLGDREKKRQEGKSLTEETTEIARLIFFLFRASKRRKNYP